MRRHLLAAVLSGALIALTALASAAPDSVPGVATPMKGYTAPSEGDPEFDCRIHGNRICGPQKPRDARFPGLDL